MLVFILKSSACLAVFMLFYKLFLEKESIHHFKRFYLLGALLVSIVIPFITFTQYIEVEPIQDLVPFQPLEFSTIEPLVFEDTKTWQDYIPTILWSIYSLGVLLFSIRFILNLKTIFYRIKNNPKHQYHEFTNVLLNDLITPHTFFKYIFLNKNKYEHNLIPNEVLLHEQTHAKQKHALDILCIEVLQIVFWFNPLLYFIKKDIRLNHEFLADQAVLQKGFDAVQYKQTLLTFSSPDNYRKANESSLVNPINYSLIKKRFNVMKSKTSKQAFWLRSLILLPILAILIYSFSQKKVVEKEISYKDYNKEQQNKSLKVKRELYNFLVKKREAAINALDKSSTKDSTEFKLIEGRLNVIKKDIDKSINTSTKSIKENLNELQQQVTTTTSKKNQQTKNTKVIPESYFEGVRFIYYNKGIQYNDTIIGKNEDIIFNKAYKDFTEAEKKNNHTIGIMTYIPKPYRKKPPTQKEMNELKDPKTFAIWIDGVNVPNSELKKYKPKDFALYRGRAYITKKGRRGKYPQAFWCNFYTHKFFDENKMGEQETKSLRKIIAVFKAVEKVNRNYKESANVPSPVKKNTKKGPHAEEIVYVQQQATSEQIAEYNKISKHYNSKPIEKRIYKQRDLNRLKYLYDLMSDEQKKNAEPFPKIAPPPPPPVVKLSDADKKYKSKELQEAWEAFKTEGDKYGKAVNNYFTNKVGELSALKEQYKEVMRLYNNYKELADKKTIVPPPPPPIKSTKKGPQVDDFLEIQQTPINNDPIKVLKTNKNKDIILLEDWYITIKDKRYYYPYKKGDLRKYYDKYGNEVNLDIVKEYKVKNKALEKLKNQGKHYIYKTKSEKREMDHLFSDLGGMYFRMPKTLKEKVNPPKSPQYPYLTLTKKNGEVYYKKSSELTDEDKKLLPKRLLKHFN